MLCLTWQETGGPSVAKPTRRGFGTRMIERGLKHDLQGDATLVFASDGLRCVITMPLAAQQAVA